MLFFCSLETFNTFEIKDDDQSWLVGSKMFFFTILFGMTSDLSYINCFSTGFKPPTNHADIDG